MKHSRTVPPKLEGAREWNIELYPSWIDVNSSVLKPPMEEIP